MENMTKWSPWTRRLSQTGDIIIHLHVYLYGDRTRNMKTVETYREQLADGITATTMLASENVQSKGARLHTMAEIFQQQYPDNRSPLGR